MRDKRPNILFAFADDWGRYASCYAEIQGENSLSALIDTPNVDRIAQEGVLFSNAFVPAPTCTPCRSSLLSGRYFWQTRLGAILQGAVFDRSIPTYPVLMEKAGFDVGFSYKVWGPGTPINDPYVENGNRYQNAGSSFGVFSFEATENLVKRGGGHGVAAVEEAKAPLYEEVLKNFTDFLEDRDDTKPFCYWWGPTNTHRKWQPGSGKALWGLDPDDLAGRLPAFFPDVDAVREDVADYLGECMAFDRGLGVIIDKLEQIGELDNTLIVVSGDHGIPGFPRGKCNLYDLGSEVALVARLPGMIAPGRVVEDMVNIMDLASTFLEIGGVESPEGMVARSLVPVLQSTDSGQVDPERTFVVTGRERHVAAAREWNLPYPHRAIRTKDYLYIRNFEPDRWPAGDPRGLDDPATEAPPFELLEHDTFAAYADCDAGPTKAWMVQHRADEDQRVIFRLGFGRRPAEELYAVKADPYHMNNLASDPTYQVQKDELASALMRVLVEQNDPRVCEEDCRYEHSPYTDLYVAHEEAVDAQERWGRS
jgi:N-sulfoglucosamine sulfohydrolase